MTENDMLYQLKEQLSPKRFKHSLGVSSIAVELARFYGADIEKAKIAGLLHDCARDKSDVELYDMARTAGCCLSEVDLKVPALIHAPVGAYCARNYYEVEDDEILQAIAMHTVGGREMSKLAAIIYIADFIEPGRDFSGVDKLRKAAYQGLDSALLACYDESINYCIAKKSLIHPATIEGRNYLLIKNAVTK